MVSGLLSPSEVCSAQERIYQNPFDPSIPYDEAKLKEYMDLQLHRSQKIHATAVVELEETDTIPALLEQRRTYRSFLTEQKVPFAVFSQWLTVLRQRKTGSTVRSYYPSAGGLYPLDFYLYIKPWRVEGIKQGFYYYDPTQHRLLLVNAIDRVIAEIMM